MGWNGTTFGDLVKACEGAKIGEPEWHFNGDDHIPVQARWLTTKGAVVCQIEPLGVSAVL